VTRAGQPNRVVPALYHFRGDRGDIRNGTKWKNRGKGRHRGGKKHQTRF